MKSNSRKSFLRLIMYPLGYPPPILTIHGDKDKFVHYNHAIRLHQALAQAGVPNQLYTVSGAAHGGYSKHQKQEIYTTIKRFLIKQGIIRDAS